MTLDEKLRAHIRDLYDRGLYVQAYEASRAAGDLWQWSEPSDRVLAGRLAANLGADRLASLLHRLAVRTDPNDWEARYFDVWGALRRQGVLEIWERHVAWGEPTGRPADFQADWLAQRAHLAGYLRDFARARDLLERAERLAPQRAWIQVERGDLELREDRRDEALERFERALALRPWYRPAVQARSHALIQADRLDEAESFLREAAGQLESGDVLAALATVLSEQERFAEARDVWRSIEPLYPLLRFDRRRRRWLHAALSEAEYACGDFAAAADWAERSKSPFHLEIAKRLREAPSTEGQRVILPVGFTWQHHMTCAPATLTTLARYWGREAQHLDVAEAICYDGTAAASERQWALDQGYVAREFQVSWDAAVRLIDAGIPFTLTTVDPGSGHLQAVIGYDRFRETLLLRDPNSRPLGECRGRALLEHYRPTGPRGMVLIPPDRAGALEGIELPEADRYDRVFEVEMALRRHDRPAAMAALDRLRQSGPDHRLTLQATRAIAAYDRNLPASFRAVEKLAAMFPDDVNLLLARFSGLREQGRREEALGLLREHCERLDADPLVRETYARELSADARRNAQVLDLLRRVLRERPDRAGPVALLADVTWSQREFDRALEYFRLATCLDDKDEDAAKSYFLAARNRRRTDEALALLKDRATRYEKRSTYPARTYAWGLEQLDRTEEATRVIERALELHPEDGDLMLFAADFALNYGDRKKAAERLTAARARAPRGAWLRAAAQFARFDGDLAKALKAWQEVLKREPLAADANDAVAALLAETAGPDAAWEHACRQAKRFPLNRAVRTTQLDQARRRSPGEAERVARELATNQPDDPWVRRELVLILLEQRRYDEAATEADAAVALDPNSPAGYYIRGRVAEGALRRDEARADYRRSLELAIDYLPPLAALLGLCEGREERVAELAFIARELERQVSFGDGVLHYRAYASRTLEPTEILELMRAARKARPDLWQTWSGHVQQYLDCGDLAEAASLAAEAVRRFPLVPRLWLDRARVHESLGEEDERLAAVRRALEIAPGWATAERELADILAERGKPEEAYKTLRRAAQRAPLDVDLHVAIAELHWRLKRPDRAFQRLRTAVQLDPELARAWALLRAWAKEKGDAEQVLVPARQLAERRPAEPNSHLVLADSLDEFDRPEEALVAIERAVALDPTNVEAHGLRAFLLAKLGRFDEALEACSPPPFGLTPPLDLQARAAQVQATRGDLADAIARLRALVAIDPDYVWAWGQLAEWSDRVGDLPLNLEASEALVRLAPTRATSHGYVGDALLRSGRRPEAKQAFQRALKLDPAYAFALTSLAEMYLEDSEFAELARMLAGADPRLPSGLAAAYRVRSAVGQRLYDQAPGLLRRLVAEPIEEVAVLKTAFQGLEEASLGREALAALHERMLAPKPPLAILQSFTRRAGRSSETARLCQVADALATEPGLLEEMLVEWSDLSSNLGDANAVRTLRQRYGEFARTRERTWSSLGAALFRIGDVDGARNWLLAPPTPSRGGCEGLLFLALTHDARGEFDAAHELHRAALQRSPDEPFYVFHELLDAVDAALRGDVQTGVGRYERLTEISRRCDAEAFDDRLFQTMHAQLRSLLAIRGRASDVGRWDYATARDAAPVGRLGAEAATLDRALARRFRIALARETGAWFHWLAARAKGFVDRLAGR